MMHIILLYSKGCRKENLAKIDDTLKMRPDICYRKYRHNDFIVDEVVLKKLLDRSEDGFDTIVNNKVKPVINDMYYSECCSWLLKDIDNRMKSFIMLLCDDQWNICKIISGYPGISYQLELI